MKKFYIFLTAFIFICFLIPSAYAKTQNVLNENNQSVQLLKTLINEGKSIRADEPPVEKAYIGDDSAHVNELKQQFEDEAYGDIFNRKNPNKRWGIFE